MYFHRYASIGLSGEIELTYDQGVAFVGVGSTGNEVEVVNEWPKGGREEKVPTRIAYEADDSKLSQDAHGYKIPAGIKSYGWFKLHLDKKTEPTDFDDPRLATELGLGIGALPQHKSAVDVTVDYLRFVVKETFAFLERRMGKETLQETPIKYFLTTPALWSFRSRELTRKAALEAGIGDTINSLGVMDKLFIVDEPEAAAIAAVKTSLDRRPGSNPFKVCYRVQKCVKLIVAANMFCGSVDTASSWRI